LTTEVSVYDAPKDEKKDWNPATETNMKEGDFYD